jgi:phage terminase small subunit
LRIMNTPTEDPLRRDRMAIAAAPFCHRRASEKGGKKEEREKKAGIAGAGRFGSGEAPKLVKMVGGK